MADASNVQVDFRGGEWGPYAQGRFDDKDYERGLNVCLNWYPIEEGAVTRRQGTRFVCYTNAGLYAWLYTFAFATASPYVMEFTDSTLRFISKGATLVMTNDPQTVTISSASPAVVTTPAAHGWSTNDVVQFLFTALTDNSAAAVLMNRQFIITVLSSTTFSIADAVTGVDVDGSTFTAPAGLLVGRVLAIAAPWTEAQLPSVRIVQAEVLSNNVLQGQVICLHGSVTPRVVTNTAPDSTGAFASFSLSAITFKDGPYFDPPTGLTHNAITPSAKTGTVSITGFPASTFVSTDVGRLIRIYSEPLDWAAGTAYVAGNVVKYTDGNCYTAVAGSTGKNPDTNYALWAPNPTGSVWAWGTITSVDSATSVHVALDSSQALLYTTAFTTFRLGLYSGTTGYPTNGVFHEGRLFLAGAQGNRFDGSVSNDPFNFAPTAVDGTVGDANAISYIFNSDDVNPIVWMATDHSGIIAGTIGGEYVIQASSLNDPLTPTSIQAHRVTKYKCANTPPARAGLGLLFVKAYAKRLMEYVSDVFSGRFMGRHVSEKAQHITAPGIAQVVYQQDLSPNAWVRMSDGTWAGMLYRRDSSFTTEPPAFTAWHRHSLGSGATVESIAKGPSADGTLEALFMSVLDPVTGFRHIEMLTDQFVSGNNIASAWYVDGAMPATQMIENSAKTQVTFYGFTPYIGRTISLWVGGLDLGDYTVASDGSITVTLGGAAQSSTVGLGLPLFTDAYLQSYVGSSLTTYDTSTLVKFVQPTVSLGAQYYFDNSVITSFGSFYVAYNPGQNQVVEAGIGNSDPGAGFKVFDATSGLVVKYVPWSTLFAGITGGDNTVNADPLTIDSANNLYFYTGTSMRKMSLNTMRLTGAYYKKNFTPLPGSMATVSYNGQNYLLFSGNVGGSIVLINGTTMSYVASGTGTTGLHGVNQICAGPQTTTGKFSSAVFYIIGSVNIASTTAITVYSFPVNGALTTSGTITPANIDAAWTHIDKVVGPVYDKTDGNIIFFVRTNDAVTNTHYVMKVNPLTAAIVWKTAITDFPSDSLMMNQSNVQYGTLAWFGAGTTTFSSVVTATGVVTDTTVPGFGAAGTWFDDATGYLYANGSLTAGAGAPVALNGTPASFSNKWCRLGGASTPPASSIQTINIPVLPAVAGFTYNSDLQRLRPVGPGETGAKDGPGFAKTRRNSRAGLQVASTQGLFCATAFDGTLLPVPFKTGDGFTPYAVNVMFTGVTRMSIVDRHSYDGMIACRVSRPYPATITALGGFLDTQDLGSEK